jgi:hypothetical protein
MTKPPKKRTHGGSTCSFCGGVFKTTKLRFKHAKDCSERLAPKTR